MKKLSIFCLACIVLMSCSCIKEHGVSPIVKTPDGIIIVKSAGSPTNTYSKMNSSEPIGIYTMVIPFSVTPVNGNVYIPAGVNFMGGGSVDKPSVSSNIAAIEYTVDNGSAIVDNFCLCTKAVVVYTGNNTLTVDANGNYEIPAGKTFPFEIVITYPCHSAGSYRAQLASVNANTDDSSTSYVIYTEGLKTFSTSYVTGN